MTLTQPQTTATLPQPAADGPAPLIELAGVTKAYWKTHNRHDTLKGGLIGSLSARTRRDLIVALDRIDLRVGRGETLGLIGPNGSGKSTLLKMIAGISQPTEGRVDVRGRVLGMIELGTGFHPDLTGEENIRLQAAIYGMDPGEMARLTPAILEFAGLRDFRHMPVKHYSSGMFLRLGFAIAIHARPDILLVDEVLAVGDEFFQERCIQAIRALRRDGVTLIFVTHFPEQIERLCERVIWLDKGKVRRLGPARHVLADYHAEYIQNGYAAVQGELDQKAITVGLPGRFGNGQARIERATIVDAAGQPCTNFRLGQGIGVQIEYSAQPHIKQVDCAIPLDSFDGTTLAHWRAQRGGVLGTPGPGGRGRLSVSLQDPPLLPGRYSLIVALSPPGDPYTHYDVLYKLLHFSIEPAPDWDTVAPLRLNCSVRTQAS